ncbi:DinB family protein [Spirosoma sp. BT702]|uniref:DinB family protein n=1 Tax=Spirosoma profusum TaxID=2771354 RepID=A0A926XX17_9BACT|nr:DinB family protein [Spirosoma profusum]MBD2699258.1 DinB family protein [Spirosoma profusum]
MRDHLIQLLNYELWANQRVIGALETIKNPPARAIAVMGHILSAQHVWLGRITNDPAFVAIWEDTPVSWMGEIAERQHRQLVSYVTSLSETDFSKLIAYNTSRGEPFENTVFDILTHTSHHAAYHRGQVVQLIRPMVETAPVTDYIFWMRES